MNTLNKGFSEDMKKKNPNEIKFYFTFHNKFFSGQKTILNTVFTVPDVVFTN